MKSDDRSGKPGRQVHQKKFHFDHSYTEHPQLFEHLLLYQIGDLSCEGGFRIHEHCQTCYEISYIVSGKGIYYTNGRAYPVQEGTIYLSLPGEYHDGLADQLDPFRYFYVGFTFNDNNPESNPLSHIKAMFDQVKNPLKTDRFHIQDPFLKLFNELLQVKTYSNLLIKTYLYQIVVFAYRNFYDPWEKNYRPEGESDQTQQLVYDVIHLIDTHLEQITELSRIAADLGYNYAYLSRIFSSRTGLSIQEYYHQKKFDRAAELLKSSGLSVTQIAARLHYQSIHSFSRAFHRNFGLSPSAYQELWTQACGLGTTDGQIRLKTPFEEA